MYAVKPFIKEKVKEKDRTRRVLAIVGDTQVMNRPTKVRGQACFIDVIGG